MLTTTILAYPYQQYADDADVQAFFAAYNAATQNIITWFASIGLPFYPGLTAPLLDWVASGLYDLERPSLTQTVTGAVGMLNTQVLDSAPLNDFTAPTVTFYNVTDDIYQRILTWNFYKGDGKRFCMKWLKRRIMRFLIGTNGLDPNPLAPSFVLGAENTQAISVTVVNDVLTVTINGAYISSLVQLQPNMLQIFQAAFLGGVLDLPAQYTYACNIVSTLTVTASPASVNAVGIATTLTTPTVSISAIAGVGTLTVAWTWLSGGTGITINSPTQLDTSFTATGMARGASLSGVALCAVTDSAAHHATAVVDVGIQNVSVPSVHIAPTSLTTTIATGTYQSPQFVATISGGADPYSILWSWQAGGGGIEINNPMGAGTVLIIPNIAPGTTDSGTLLVSVIDAYGQPASATAAVSVARATLLQAVASPASLSASSQTTPITTGNTTVTPSGGQAPYSFSWTFNFTSESQKDGATGTIGSPQSATTNFVASGMSAGSVDSGIAPCVVTDALGQQALVNLPVSFTYNPPAPVQRTYTTPGSYTDVAPFNGHIVIEIVSPGGGGEGGSYNHALNQSNGGTGGDSGSYCRSVYAVLAGQTVHATLGSPGAGGAGGNFGLPGAGGTSTVSSGTLAITTMTAPGGNTGGTPSGGNQANAGPNHGTAGGLNTAGQGGAGISGQYIPSAYGAGGRGGLGLGAGAPGGGGIVSFYYYSG